MARAFNGSSDLIDVGDCTFCEGLTYFSIAGWINIASLSNYMGMFQKAGSFTLGTAGNFDNGSDDAYVQFLDGAQALATNANILSTGVWNHFAVVFDGSLTGSTNRLRLYFNGVLQTLGGIGGGGAVGSTIPASANNLTFGRGKDGFLAQRHAEFGAWSAALTAADCLGLAAGYAPPLVRPDALEAWWPFTGNDSPEIDRVGGNNGTLTGTSKYAHPRIIYPRRRSAETFTGTSPPPPPPSTYIGARFQMIGSGIQQFSGGRAA